ncbi:MAG TPA: fibronectin type III domain-containing protein [Acidobacteriaceae bacterium]|jgi:hypothetical protein
MMPGNRRGRDRRRIALPAALFPATILGGGLASLLAGCAAPAAPQPPTLNLPQPVRDLAAKRIGDSVHLTFTVPRKTTDKLPVRGAVTASLCRSVETGPCQSAGTLAIPDQRQSSAMDDALPAELRQGPPRLLTYKVSILNRAGKSAGESDSAYTLAGVAPPQVAAFTVSPRRNGIVLAWQGIEVPAGANLRVDRTLISAPPQPENSEASHNSLTGRKTAAEPAEQVLRMPEAASEQRSFAIDTTAHTGNSYRYIAQRIQQVTLGGHTLEIASQPSAPAETAYRDVFPPPMPTGLVSAADTSAKAIDLDWTPDVDPGLAGYIVYRRAVSSPGGSSETPQRISPAGKPVTTSAWSDTTALPGRRYAYSVSAIDVSGNESQRSTEVQDEWNTPSSQPNP